jgi:HAD superfamily hydrolase (TIGR01484 family)
MPDRLLLATDLDRTLIPNGPEPESRDARNRFATLVCRADISLAYVSGRDRALVEQAMRDYRLPQPDFVVGDVGTTIYEVNSPGRWRRLTEWEHEIARDWSGLGHDGLAASLRNLEPLRLQERARQNRCKLSYYVPLYEDFDALSVRIRTRLAATGVRARLVWSIDDPAGVGLLDILPERASKRHAIEALMEIRGFERSGTVFCGDSGNDLEVLASPIPAVLVANATADVKARARALAAEAGYDAELYVAGGNFMGMNGNYSAGILEGFAHYHPHTVGWMTLQPGDPA